MAQGPTFDKNSFLTNFQGMEDLAKETIASFLSTLPELISNIEAAINSKSAEQLEIAAHTLKGAVSNFYAEPSKNFAFQLEQMGRKKTVDGSDKIFQELKTELARLSEDLKKELK